MGIMNVCIQTAILYGLNICKALYMYTLCVKMAQ